MSEINKTIQKDSGPYIHTYPSTGLLYITTRVLSIITNLTQQFYLFFHSDSASTRVFNPVHEHIKPSLSIEAALRHPSDGCAQSMFRLISHRPPAGGFYIQHQSVYLIAQSFSSVPAGHLSLPGNPPGPPHAPGLRCFWHLWLPSASSVPH